MSILVIMVVVMMVMAMVTFALALVVIVVMIVFVVVIMVVLVLVVMVVIMLMIVLVLAMMAMLMIRKLFFLLHNSRRWRMVCSARVSISVNQVVAAVLRTCLGKLHRGHSSHPVLVVGVPSIKPPCVDLSRDAAIRAVLLELVRLIWLPNRVDLLLGVGHISRNIHRTIREPVPSQGPDRSEVPRRLVRVILGVILQKLPRSVAHLGVTIEPMLNLTLCNIWTEP
jgi:hypothetical protein